MPSLKLFAVLDRKAGYFKSPFFMLSIGEATRAMMNAMADPNTDLAKYPEDFALYEVGTWNDTSGVFTQEGAMTHICNLTALSPKPVPTDSDFRTIDGQGFFKEAAQ